MYSASSHQIREEFWKTFGKYMSLVPSASGEKINWINYKTGNKAVRFSLNVDSDTASVRVLISDAAIVDQLISLQQLFSTIDQRDWEWSDNSISIQLKGKNIRNKEDWPDIISFFKQGLITLDSFWTEVRDFIA